MSQPARGISIESMRQVRRLEVEVYAHGRWWKDSRGRTGQIPQEQASKGPVATIALVANGFGASGWDLTDVTSAQHNTYRLSFEKAPERAGTDEERGPQLARQTSISLG